MVIASNWDLRTIASNPHEFLSWIEERGMPVAVFAAEKRPLIVQTPPLFRETARWFELVRHYLRNPSATT